MKEEIIFKKSISLREDIHQYALEQAEKFHGGNFSAYITYLISSRKNNTDYITYNNGKKEIVLTREKLDGLLNNDVWQRELIEVFYDGFEVVATDHLVVKSTTIKRLIEKYFVVKSMGLDKKYDISFKI
ncbi:hypothetical protein [Neobacillus rhizophilus]|uniref:Uncharacterized protein n=1 Tax=Neobacillus rhizophilus TaxID=2833579 RepID=A0A942U283_9BACI|nr:hypothetical protein [Neobacillus rhizophilus]MBS4213235.1 hypothetical protein [Neobacillus rhizophilus]